MKVNQFIMINIILVMIMLWYASASFPDSNDDGGTGIIDFDDDPGQEDSHIDPDDYGSSMRRYKKKPNDKRKKDPKQTGRKNGQSTTNTTSGPPMGSQIRISVKPNAPGIQIPAVGKTTKKTMPAVPLTKATVKTTKPTTTTKTTTKPTTTTKTTTKPTTTTKATTKSTTTTKATTKPTTTTKTTTKLTKATKPPAKPPSATKLTTKPTTTKLPITKPTPTKPTTTKQTTTTKTTHKTTPKLTTTTKKTTIPIKTTMKTKNPGPTTKKPPNPTPTTEKLPKPTLTIENTTQLTRTTENATKPTPTTEKVTKPTTKTSTIAPTTEEITTTAILITPEAMKLQSVETVCRQDSQKAKCSELCGILKKGAREDKGGFLGVFLIIMNIILVFPLIIALVIFIKLWKKKKSEVVKSISPKVKSITAPSLKSHSPGNQQVTDKRVFEDDETKDDSTPAAPSEANPFARMQPKKKVHSKSTKQRYFAAIAKQKAQEDEDRKDSNYIKMGKVYFPLEIDDSAFKQQGDFPKEPVVLEKLTYNPAKNERFFIGSEIDDVEYAPSEVSSEDDDESAKDGRNLKKPASSSRGASSPAVAPPVFTPAKTSRTPKVGTPVTPVESIKKKSVEKPKKPT